METRPFANPSAQNLIALGTTADQRGFRRAGEASETEYTAIAVSQNIPENARAHRCAEAHGRRGCLSIFSSEKWSQHSLPGPALHEAFPSDSSSEERNPSQNHRRHPRASFCGEHVRISATCYRGSMRSFSSGSGKRARGKGGTAMTGAV